MSSGKMKKKSLNQMLPVAAYEIGQQSRGISQRFRKIFEAFSS